jgi:hypothetical protein
MVRSKEDTQFKFIYDYDTFYLDLLILNDSNYINVRLDKTYFIFLLYNAANKRVFVKLMKNKTAKESVVCFQEF